MLKISIIVVGKLKEKYLKEGIRDYLNRCRFYATINIRELKDFGRDNQRQLTIQKESELIIQELQRINNSNSYSILLDLSGKQISSEEMAIHINKIQNRGISHIIWIIGGSYGVNDQVKQAVNEKISFSKLTFPHGLMRLILSEQIYRWLSINAGTNYHK